MNPHSRAIRLFVSSTFSDMKAERDLLQRAVFPKLKQLCLSKGLRFQAIDLRWGVSEEAGRHNRTMRICLRELARCQHGTPKPNFLVLLGDRYGWRPLPETIRADLFERLKPWVESDSPQAAAALRWYRRDGNTALAGSGCVMVLRWLCWKQPCWEMNASSYTAYTRAGSGSH